MVSLIAAATVVVALLITTPVMVGMYLEINKTKFVLEKKVQAMDNQLEQLKKELEHDKRSNR
jgi:uncharacterized membrane protein (DUF106 family)